MAESRFLVQALCRKNSRLFSPKSDRRGLIATPMLLTYCQTRILRLPSHILLIRLAQRTFHFVHEGLVGVIYNGSPRLRLIN